MSILLAESFELAANGVLDLTIGEDYKYVSAETRSAFWAWCESRQGVAVSLPHPISTSEDEEGLDLFTRKQFSEMVNAAGIVLK